MTWSMQTKFTKTLHTLQRVLWWREAHLNVPHSLLLRTVLIINIGPVPAVEQTRGNGMCSRISLQVTVGIFKPESLIQHNVTASVTD